MYITKNCIGCTACAQICPKSAITLNNNSRFYTYMINEDLCVNCGLCYKSCQQNSEAITSLLHKDKLEVRNLFALKNLNDDIRKRSTSGGAFYLLAQKWISMGGYVCGATFAEGIVKHIIIHSEMDIPQLMGSKYVQSYMGDIYLKIRDLLSKNNYVLFSGTPCQVASLQGYLSKHKGLRGKLMCVDLICHGVISPKLFSGYLSVIEKKYHSKVKNVVFRAKDRGWRFFMMKIYLSDGRCVFRSQSVKSFVELFNNNYGFNDSCYGCKYARPERVGDITLADFWKIKNTDLSSIDDNTGISFVLANTREGLDLINQIKDQCWIAEPDISAEDYYDTYNNNNMVNKNADLWQDLDKYGAEFCIKKYGNINIGHSIRNTIVEFLYTAKVIEKVRALRNRLKK